jgi:hypothetical protein
VEGDSVRKGTDQRSRAERGSAQLLRHARLGVRGIRTDQCWESRTCGSWDTPSRTPGVQATADSLRCASAIGGAGDHETCDATERHVRRPARRTNTMVPILVAALVVFGLPTLYFAIRSREFRKFLAGAFFVSGGMQSYFYLANVSVPLVGTSIVQTPEVSGVRSILHFIFFLVTFYFGFIRKPKDPST